MGRSKRPDRAWWRWRDVAGERRLQLCVVRGGTATTTLLDRGATEADAGRAVKIAVATMDAGTWTRPNDWPEAIDAYCDHLRREGNREISLRAVRTKLQAVARTITGDPLALARADAAAHRDARAAAGMSPSTIRSEIRAVAQLQAWMLARKWVPAATWADAPLPDGERGKRLLRPHEVGPWLRAAEDLGRERKAWRRWPLAAWLLLHGMRVGELHALRVEDIDTVGGVVMLRDRPEYRLKTPGSARTIPLCHEATVCARRVLAGLRPEAGAFPRPVSGERMTTNDPWIRLMTYRTCERAGLARVCPHALRHGNATQAGDLGIPLDQVGRSLGHADPSMTLHYQHSAGASRGVLSPYHDWLDRAFAGGDIGAETVQAAPGIAASDREC